MISEIKKTTKLLINSLVHVKENGVKQYFQYDINCSLLQDWNLSDIQKSPEHKEAFKKLETITGPVVYWFEISSPTPSEEIRKRIFTYKFSKESKSVPALKSNYNNKSRALYVGKVKRKFWGRIIQHLGYYPVKRTQGLQLYHWARDIDLTLRLHAYEFETEMEDLVVVIELKLARHLNPITGKHS